MSLARFQNPADAFAASAPRINLEPRARFECDPPLASEASFPALQTELSATETRLALARADHAEIHSFFLTRTQIIPDR